MRPRSKVGGQLDRGRDVSLCKANKMVQDLLYKLALPVNGETGEQPMLRWPVGLAGPACHPYPSVRIQPLPRRTAPLFSRSGL